jgi:hypothetical protein
MREWAAGFPHMKLVVPFFRCGRSRASESGRRSKNLFAHVLLSA